MYNGSYFINPIWYNKNRDSPMALHRLSSMFVFEEGRVPQGMRFFSVHKFIVFLYELQEEVANSCYS